MYNTCYNPFITRFVSNSFQTEQHIMIKKLQNEDLDRDFKSWESFMAKFCMFFYVLNNALKKL